MFYKVIAGAVAVGFAAPAFAGSYEPAPAEPVVVAPEPVQMAPASDWTGFYLGGQAGYLNGNADANGDSTDFDGFVGGIYGGYNHDFGKFVIGGEADYNWANGEFDANNDVKVNQLARLKLRAGYDAGKLLPYIAGGAAYANVDADGTDYNDWGWALGAGVDYKVTDNWTAGVEYMYQKFDDFDDQGFDLTGNTIMARVGYSF